MNPVPVLASETVSPAESPVLRSTFDGYSPIRRLGLDPISTDSSFELVKKKPRIQDSRRGSDPEPRSRTSSRRRDSISSQKSSRDKSISRKPAADTGLDWLKKNHQRLSARAEQIARERREAAQNGPAVSNARPAIAAQVQTQPGKSFVSYTFRSCKFYFSWRSTVQVFTNPSIA